MPVLTLQRVDTPDTINIHYETGGETLGWLRQQVKSSITRRPFSERVRLVKLLLDDQILASGDDEKSLDYFTVSPGPWLVRPVFVKPRIVIFVKALNGKTLTFSVFREDTIAELKEKIHEKQGIKPAQQRLIYSNKELQDSLSISQYNIPREATIHLALSLPGGLNATTPIRFVDMTNSKGLKTRKWAKGAPTWRVAAPGLSLEGICTNGDCGAYSSMVIIPWGQTNFDFYYDEHKSACPLCKKHVRPITCGFNNTWWIYSGSKKVGSGHPPQSVSSDWEYAKDGYHYFDREKCGEVDWGRLKLFVSSKDPSVTRSEFESS